MTMAVDAASTSPPGLLFRLGQRLHDAIPSPATVLFGSAAWGLAMAFSAMIGLYWRHELILFSGLAVISLFFYGAAVGFAPGLWLADLICGEAGPVTRFTIGTVILGLATHTATAAIFALQYRVFYAHWHAPFLTVVWCYQQIFTTASALYQFTVDSEYVYVPLAPVALLPLGVWFARRVH